MTHHPRPFGEHLKAHLQRAIEQEDGRILLEPRVLAVAAAALNEAVPVVPSGHRMDVAEVEVDIVSDVALMHVIRCQALAGEPAERYEYQAAAALSTLVALLDAGRVAPQLREVVDDALEQGAPTETEPAALWALDSYAALLEGETSRTGSPDVLDAAITMRQRVVDAMPPNHPGTAGARTDVAMLHVRRFDTSDHIEDLDHAIELLQQAITHAQQEDQRAEAQRLLEIVRDHRAALVRDET